MVQLVKNLPAMQEITLNAGGLCLIPGLGRSPGKGHGNPLQYSCLENPMDRETWQATVHGVAKSPTDLTTLPLPPATYKLHGFFCFFPVLSKPCPESILLLLHPMFCGVLRWVPQKQSMWWDSWLSDFSGKVLLGEGV